MRPNTLLVKYPGGYLERSDATRVAAEGRVERLVTFQTPYRQQVEHLADSMLADLASPWAVTVDYLPTSPAEEPYTGYQVGDEMTYPDHTGTPTTKRVMAVSVTADEEGNPIFVPELGEVPAAEAVRIQGEASAGASAATEAVKFSSPEFTGQFGGGGGQGYVGGTGLRSGDPQSGVFAGAYGTGAEAPRPYTVMAEGGEFAFALHGSIAEAAGEEDALIWPPYRIRSRRKLTGWTVSLLSAAEGPLTVHLWHEGTEVDVTTVPAGTQRVLRKLQPPIVVEAGDMVYPSIDVT